MLPEPVFVFFLLWMAVGLNNGVYEIISQCAFNPLLNRECGMWSNPALNNTSKENNVQKTLKPMAGRDRGISWI